MGLLATISRSGSLTKYFQFMARACPDRSTDPADEHAATDPKSAGVIPQSYLFLFVCELAFGREF